MFWGLILKSNKRYTQKVRVPFFVTQAALDYTTADNDPVQVMCIHQENSFLLCTLQKGKLEQCPLNLKFGIGEISFAVHGNAIVHLKGNLIPQKMEIMDTSETYNAEECDDSPVNYEPPKKVTKFNGDGEVMQMQHGLMIEVLKVGKGKIAKNGSKIVISFESRIHGSNKILSQGVEHQHFLAEGSMFKGLVQGIIGMKVGGKRRIFMPRELVRIADETPQIPKGKNLIFDVALINVL